jgi:hypothetical protein
MPRELARRGNANVERLDFSVRVQHVFVDFESTEARGGF